MNKEKNKLETARHSLAHILATAVLDMFPEAKFGTGPATENGFFYDFELPRTLIPEDLPILEEKMRAIIKANIKIEEASTDIKKIEEDFIKAQQPYKVELINDIKSQLSSPDSEISIYKINGFVDLCKGPHLDSTGEIDPESFKLSRISGAYWKSNEKNKQLQRIYGLAFENKKELDEYLKQIEEAEKRDHRKIGKDLDLFCFSDLVGPGLPLFTPKGVIIIEELKKHIENVCRNHGFEKVMCPSLAKIELFEMSGHAKKFGEELFKVTSSREHDFALKPVQCPHHTQIYASKSRSYRDLPIRYMESDKMYRAEKSGEVGGLSRVYAITVEDGHSFCRIDQVKEEVKNLINIIKDFYSAIGMWDNHWVSLSVRDYDHPEKYIGEKEDWDFCEKMLEEISNEMGLDAKRSEGEAALYGPKIDFMFKDALGKEIQIPTVQLDFATPKRFELSYINEKGEKENPVMVHRAVLGSYERFLVLLIEHFAGAFPLWLSPIQIKIVPVSEKFNKYGNKILEELKKNNIRAEIDESDESLGKRIRNAEKQKIPYILVVGEKEESSESVAIRSRDTKEQTVLKTTEFVEKTLEEIKNKK
jgi:threonyl-tRNA synthetase